MRKDLARRLLDGDLQADPGAGQGEARVGAPDLLDRALQGTQGAAPGTGSQPGRRAAEAVPVEKRPAIHEAFRHFGMI